jgi:Tol biopolymer transport system component
MKLHVFAVTFSIFVVPAFGKDTVLFNRIGPSRITLFVANGEGLDARPLFPASGFDYSPSFSPDGRWIVFTSERDGSADIYRAHPDGSALERLTDDPAFDDQGALSPDGARLAFVSTRGSGTADVWVLDLKSRKARNLTETGGAPELAKRLRGNFRPSWSPDGKWIAFSSDRNTEFIAHQDGGRKRGPLTPPAASGWEHTQAASIYLIQAGGAGLRRLTGGTAFEGSPSWSADGKRVVFYEMQAADTFVVRRPSPGDPSTVTSQIVSVDLATGARIEHTSGPGVKVAPRFVAPDRLAYLIKAAPPGARQGIAFTSGAQGADGVMRNPSWSPDGKQLVYQQLDFAPRGQNQPFYAKTPELDLRYSDVMPALSKDRQLVLTDFRAALNDPRASISVMDADGSNQRRVFLGEDGAALAPAWSPDGNWIAFGLGAFFGSRQKLPARIVMVAADGSQRKDLTDGRVNSGFPSFSPDGRHLVFRVWADDERGLRILDLETLSVTKLTADSDNFPKWSPDGDLISFTRAVDGAFDIYSIRPDGTDLRRLTDAPGNDAHDAWSPDGEQIVFGSSRFGFKDEAPLYEHAPQPYGEIFVMNRDGSGQRPITDNNWEDATAVWVPALAQTRAR